MDFFSWKKVRAVAAMSALAIVAGLGSAAILTQAVIVVPNSNLNYTTTIAPTLLPPQPKPEKQDTTKDLIPEDVFRTETPNDAVQAALADANQIDPLRRPFIRYIWIPGGAAADVKKLTITLETVSRSDVTQRPYPLANGRLIRIDLTKYAPQPNDLGDWIKVWEDFQFDPYFSLLLTHDELLRMPEEQRPKVKQHIKSVTTKQVPVKRKVRKLVEVPSPSPFIGQDGKFHGTMLKEQEVDEEFTADVPEVVDTIQEVPATGEGVDVIRVNGAQVNARDFLELQELLQTQAPIVNHLYFEQRALTTIKDKGVYNVVFGGRYYELAGIRKAKETKGKEKATDLDLLLEDLGLGNITAGFTADQLFDKLRSDQRIVMVRSGVTGKKRRVDWFHSPSNRNGTGVVSVTHDIRDQDVDVDADPVANLLVFQEAAFEVIFERANGMHGYALFNAKKELLDEAAPDVAVDRTIPPPHPTRLQSGISCMACHEAGGSDGWQPMRNDVKLILAGKLDIFWDLKDRRILPDQLARLAGLYGGDFSKSLERARADYSEAILRAGGPWTEGATDQTEVVKIGVGKLVKGIRTYQLDLVTPQTALEELGVHVPEKDAVNVFNTLLQPDVDAVIGDFIPEDPVFASLKVGIGVPRTDWSLRYSFAATRSQKTLRTLIEHKVGKN